MASWPEPAGNRRGGMRTDRHGGRTGHRPRRRGRGQGGRPGTVV